MGLRATVGGTDVPRIDSMVIMKKRAGRGQKGEAKTHERQKKYWRSEGKSFVGDDFI